MDIHKAKVNADLLNLSPPPIKQLKIQNKIQYLYIYKYKSIYKQISLLPGLGDNR